MALGNLKPNISWHSVTVCISQVLNNLNNFIKNRLTLTGKSSDLRLVLVKGQASIESRPYNIHLTGSSLSCITCIIAEVMLNSSPIRFYYRAKKAVSAVLGVVILSFCPSVCLSHACFVIKPNNALQIS